MVSDTATLYKSLVILTNGLNGDGKCAAHEQTGPRL